MPQASALGARSWLFAPGDSERKMTRAIASAADIVLIDLEDAVSPEAKDIARTMAHDAIAAHPEEGSRLWVRINALDTPWALEDLARIMPARPGGILLPKASRRADAEQLDHYLSALEVTCGIEEGSTPMALLVTETAEAMFHTGGYKGTRRLAALSWGAEDLSAALGATTNRCADGSYAFTYELARSLCLLGAASAGVAAIETIHADYQDIEGLSARATQARLDGFSGMLAIHPAQVEPINAAFTPSEAEVAEAEEIVALFTAQPGAGEVGAIGLRGRMLDRPHLARARALLARARCWRRQENNELDKTEG